MRNDVADLVADHRRQLIFTLEIREQAAVHEDVAVGHRKRVDVGEIENGEVKLAVRFGAVRDQAFPDLLHVLLPARVIVDLTLLGELLEGFLAGLRVRSRLPEHPSSAATTSFAMTVRTRRLELTRKRYDTAHAVSLQPLRVRSTMESCSADESRDARTIS